MGQQRQSGCLRPRVRTPILSDCARVISDSSTAYIRARSGIQKPGILNLERSIKYKLLLYRIHDHELSTLLT